MTYMYFVSVVKACKVSKWKTVQHVTHVPVNGSSLKLSTVE